MFYVRSFSVLVGVDRTRTVDCSGVCLPVTTTFPHLSGAVFEHCLLYCIDLISSVLHQHKFPLHHIDFSSEMLKFLIVSCYTVTAV